ncbi:MAG: aminoacyl--tRNA ligase-related protein [Patescibacteria group bacterium]
MMYRHLFSKPSKQAPGEGDSINARLLLQAGFIHQELSGVYSWLPLGLRVLRKVENIIREELNNLGAQEVLLTALQPQENWEKTGRWNTVDVLFKLPSQTGKEYALGPTAEEIATPLVGSFLQSYKDLPLAVYQIQTKFRDELRAKSGVLRGREFLMKDMYSFHETSADFDEYYARVIDVYLKIFNRIGVEVKVTEASGGAFSNKISHEFQIITPAGEDQLIACAKCRFAQNTEVATLAVGESCPKCGGELIATKGVEVGNIFDLNTRFSEAFKIAVTTASGERVAPHMGCYGLGVSRLVGAIVEAKHDEKGMIWPDSVAPLTVHLVSLGSGEAWEPVLEKSKDIYRTLMASGIEPLWDDRSDVSAGEKLAAADLIGIPYRIVISPKSLTAGGVELKRRDSIESRIVSCDEILGLISTKSV